MKDLKDFTYVGLRNRCTGKIDAVYPHQITGPADEVEDKVKYWYYQQGCSAESELGNLYVDVLYEHEVEEYKRMQDNK